MLRLLLVFALAGLPLAAASGDDVGYWPAAKLKSYAKELAPKVNADHYALERLGDYGNHYVLMVHRLASGPAESHEMETDFYVIEAGEATLHVGGEIVDAKTISPGEVRGSSIKGGKTMPLKVGDTVNIPPGTPHHVTIAPGKSVTYMIVKVKK